jgi:uncharacterized coiled-coil DUF342 family protein
MASDSQHLEIARLRTVIESYAASAAAAAREINHLRDERDRWMARSHSHALEAAAHRTEIIDLNGRIYELEGRLKCRTA